MKILVDENIPRMTVDALRELGHDVKDIRGNDDKGLADSLLWDVTIREGRMLVTTDKGFTEHRTTDHFGILVVLAHARISGRRGAGFDRCLCLQGVKPWRRNHPNHFSQKSSCG